MTAFLVRYWHPLHRRITRFVGGSCMHALTDRLSGLFIGLKLHALIPRSIDRCSKPNLSL